jgi:hypothetical protein
MAPSVDLAGPPPEAASGREETGQEHRQHEDEPAPSSPARRQPSPHPPPSSPQQEQPAATELPTPPPAAATSAAAPAPTTAASSTTPSSPVDAAPVLPVEGEQIKAALLTVPTLAAAVVVAASQPPTPLYSPSPKGILKRRRATAPDQHQTSDDPSVYMEGKRLRFRSMGDLSTSDRPSANHSPSPAPLSPRSGGRLNRPAGSTPVAGDRRRSSTAASALNSSAAEADAERVAEEEEGQDELGTLPSDPSRSRKLVDINQGEELRESVERLERFCEASVEVRQVSLLRTVPHAVC